MITIKLVFQGGGAKLVTLMAVASVLRDLEAEKRIRIATIAGTSAGAIAACMLAGNRTMDDYRDKVNTAGKELINHFKTSWPKAALAIKLWAGGTVFDENILRLFLQKVFNLEEGVDLKLGTLRIPTVIVASDVSTMGKYVYKSSNSSDLARNITDVLCDSCSLPFVFRSFRSSSFVVDGGVCSNLAAEELLRDDDGSHVLGFKFQDAKPSNPKNIWKYALAIMSSAISSGVRNNAERIRLSGGEVCELPNEFDTLEFEEALTRGLTTEAFTGIKERVRPKLEDSLKKFDRLERISKRAGNLPEQVFQTHRNLRRVFQYQVHKSATVITAFSLLDPSGIHYRKEDEVSGVN